MRSNARKETWVATDMGMCQYYSRTFAGTYFIRRITRLGRDILQSHATIPMCSASATVSNIDLVAVDQKKGRMLHRNFQSQILFHEKFFVEAIDGLPPFANDLTRIVN